MSFSDIMKWFNTPLGVLPEPPDDVINISPKTILYMTDANPLSIVADYYINMSGSLTYKLDRKDLVQFSKILIGDYAPRFTGKIQLKDKVLKVLKNRFPHLKNDDINLLVELYGSNVIMEILGLKKAKAKNTLTDEDIIFNVQYNLDNTCNKCTVENRPIVLHDTNVNKLDKIKFILLGEAPAKEEVKQQKPFVGRAGTYLRNKLEELGFNKYGWWMWNVVLCFHAAGNPPTNNEILNCFDNFEIVLNNMPKDIIIIPFGRTAQLRVGIPDNVTTAMNHIYKYNGFYVLPNAHPSAVIRGGIPDERFTERMKFIIDNFNQLEMYPVKSESNTTYVRKFFSNKLSRQRKKQLKQPEIQDDLNGYTRINTIYNPREGKVYLTLRKGSIKRVIEYDDTYTYWWTDTYSRFVEHMNNLNTNTTSYRNRNSSTDKYTYYKNLPITTRKNIDFSLRYEEATHDLNIMYFDIEVYIKGTKNSTDIASLAKLAPINAITLYTTYEKKYHTLIVSNNEIINDNDNVIIEQFDNDALLLERFFELLRELNPDIITGWNSSNFDWPFIMHRAKTLGIEPYDNHTKIEIINNYNDLYMIDYVSVDYLRLYRQLAMIKQDSYKLDYIAKVELGKDMGKVEYEGTLDDLYETNINKFIKYNIQDVNILIELDKKLKLIDLAFGMISITKTTWRDIFSRTVLLDGLIAYYLMRHNKVAYDRHVTDTNVEFQGAFVKDVTKGIYNWVIDLDLSSLYPYIIARLNMSIDTYYGMVPIEVALKYIFNKCDVECDSFILERYNNAPKQITYSEFEDIVNNEQLIVLPNGRLFYKHERELSIFYEIIDMLISERKKLKDKMKEMLQKDQQLYERYNMMQMAYKVLTNALYGGFGAPFFRFFLVDMAESITAVGRTIIKIGSFAAERYIQSKINNIPLEVHLDDYFDNINKLKYILYNDTDSAFVHIEPLLEKLYPNYKGMTVNEIAETVIDISTSLKNYINGVVVIELLKHMNTGDSIASKYNFTFKQELVIKRILFTGVKKRYAMWVINREGVSTDYTKAVGIEIVRTDSSRFTRRILSDLINFILKNDEVNRTHVIQWYTKVKSEFDELFYDGSIDIAKPVGWNIAKKYKNMPRHIRGMLIYETLYNTKIFEDEAVRGYEFEISKMRPNAFPEKRINLLINNNLIKPKIGVDVIVIPDTETHIDTSIFELDYKKMFDLNIKNRLSQILDIFDIDINVDCNQLTW